MADRNQTLNAAINLAQRAAELVEQLDDRPLAHNHLARSLAELRGGKYPPEGKDVPAFLMKMALALLDRQGETTAVCHLQYALDTLRGAQPMQPGEELDGALLDAFLSRPRSSEL